MIGITHMLVQVSSCSSSGMKQNVCCFSKLRFIGLWNNLMFSRTMNESSGHLFIPKQSGSELQNSDAMETLD